MTIKDFAQLCSCSTQTLRYYDKIDLLKPVKVDPWSGYRYYDSKQAIDFIKIKNLQAADFTIGEIKKLLTQSDQQVYEAFDAKIAEQAQRLERIREIQKSYLAEKNAMEKIVYSMTDYLLSQCSRPEVLTEFGLSPADAPAILVRLRAYLNRTFQGYMATTAPEDVSITVNDEVVQGQNAVLDRIHGLTEKNLEDTILLNNGYGHSVEYHCEENMEMDGYETIWERRDWGHIHEFIAELPRLEEGKTYCLWVQSNHVAFSDDLSFSMFLLGSVLDRQDLETVTLNGCLSTGADKENLFKLLRKM